MRIFSGSVIFVLITAAALQARVDLLLVPPVMPVSGQRGVEFTLYLNNPTEFAEIAHLPAELTATYASSAGHGRVRLVLANSSDVERSVPARTRQTILLRLDEPILGEAGFVSLRLLSPETNVIMFELGPPVAAAAPPTSNRELPAQHRRPLAPGRHIDLASDLENVRHHISSYDPIYFAVGWRDRFNARFQFSFKYRVFSDGPPGEVWYRQLARDLYVAYTQTSIWDLESFSKPFYDSSYKPTAFFLHEFDPNLTKDWRISLQAGGQHESNGKGSGQASMVPSSSLLSPTTPQRHPADSRNLNTLYFAPKIRWTADDGCFFEARAQVSAFFNVKRENPDIAKYRGYVELRLRAGYDRGFQFSVNARGHPNGHGSLDLNMSWPAIQTPLLKLAFPESLGGYALIQYFNGYGESLLDYDVRRKDQLRFGLMVVR